MNSFVGLFQQNYPEATIRNYGVCGSCISTEGISTIEDMYARATRMEPDADVIVVFGGTNDFACGVPLGDNADTCRSTFYGAYNALVVFLLGKYPYSKIVLTTPIHRKWENLEVKYHKPQILPLISYVNAVKDCARRYNMPCVDLFAVDEFISPDLNKVSVYTVDGIHPNDQGYQLIFEILDGRLRTLI